MMNDLQNNKYLTVIGLEIHAELKTKTKIFCSCENKFGAKPNTLCCPVCAGLIGALPVLNEKVVDLAITAGIVLNCEISRYCSFDRKNYFYPDLPKAYQITELDRPICKNGYVDISADGIDRRVRIERIHMEEDAGKLIHVNKETLVDLNRCGVPLIEIVTMPDIRSGKEARLFLEALRERLLFSGVSDCKMNEGSLRCDVNVSIKDTHTGKQYERTEIKNLNSMAFVQKAIDHEIERQRKLIANNEKIIRETRRFDEKSGRTLPMRTKEDSADYRYIPEPDLPPLNISEELIERIRMNIPTLPSNRRRIYQEKYGISEDDARRLTRDPATAECFERTAELTKFAQIAANLLISSVSDASSLDSDFPSKLAYLCDTYGEGKINSSLLKELLEKVIANGTDPKTEIEDRGLMQISSEEALLPIIKTVILENEKAVGDYLGGKKAAAKSLVGRIMKMTSGRADPLLAARLLQNELEKLR